MVQSQLILSTLYMHCHGHLLTVHTRVPQSSTNREPANANRRQLFQPIWPSPVCRVYQWILSNHRLHLELIAQSATPIVFVLSYTGRASRLI